MPAPVIRVENLSKLYRLGKKEERPRTLIETVARFASAPVRNFRQLRSLTHFDDADNARDILWALRDVSFEVAPGEVVGLIGRNGAGKSTLLKILSRIMPPTRGSVEIRGRLASLLEVGTGFHPELSGRDNIYLNGAILGMRRHEIARKFDEIVAFAEIEKFIDTPVKRYSSGMYVRLAFAVAAHLEPEILIVDEVLAVGDAAFQQKCLGKMQSVSTSEGRTVLFVSHNMWAVRSLCKRVIWFEQGRLRLEGTAREVVDTYLLQGQAESIVLNFDNIPSTNDRNSTFQLKTLVFNEGKAIRHGEPLVARFEFVTSKQISEASVGFGFCTVDGVRIFSLDTDLNEKGRNLPAGFHGSVTMTLECLHIEPGLYILDVGARSGAAHALEYFPRCMPINVLPGKGTPSSIINRQGGMRLPAESTWD